MSLIQREGSNGSHDSANARNRGVLALLLLINLFNFIDRQVLAAVVGPIKLTFFGSGSIASGAHESDQILMNVLSWSQRNFGFKPEDALVGLLGTAFLFVYMIAAPIFGGLAARYSRWMLVGVGVILWSLASGASGLAAGFGALLLTRFFVGIGEAACQAAAPNKAQGTNEPHPRQDLRGHRWREQRSG